MSLGVPDAHKARRFDRGSDAPRRPVECKSHNWTSGGNVPSAKMTVWNEAMYYFHVAPAQYRKVLFVLKSLRDGETLAAYYIRNFGHLIPTETKFGNLMSAASQLNG